MLLDQLRFPNGVQLSPAEDFVLVAETTMARIRRCVRGWLCRQQASASGRALGHVRRRDRSRRGGAAFCAVRGSEAQGALSSCRAQGC